MGPPRRRRPGRPPDAAVLGPVIRPRCYEFAGPELDRVAELSSLPKATGVRIEIRGAGGVASPASVRVLVGGKTEDEREFAKAERDAFAGNAAPLVVQVPLLPGSHKARVELSHPFWKSPVAADFTAGVAAGTTAVVRFRLAAPAGNGAPALAPMAGP